MYELKGMVRLYVKEDKLGRHKHGLTLIPAWISNYMFGKV